MGRQRRKRRDIPRLIAALENSDPDVRATAAHHLGKLRAVEAVPALQDLLDDESDFTRYRAIVALGRIDTGDATQALIRAAGHGRLVERAVAARRLGERHAVAAVPVLLECLHEDDYSLQMSALRALGRIGDERAIPRVAALAENASSLAVSTRATDVLAELGDPRAIPQFVSLLTETDRHLRRADTHMPPDGPFTKWFSKPRRVKRWTQNWAARRLVELGATEAAPAVEEAAGRARSRRERLLLRRTAVRLRQAST